MQMGETQEFWLWRSNCIFIPREGIIDEASGIHEQDRCRRHQDGQVGTRHGSSQWCRLKGYLWISPLSLDVKPTTNDRRLCLRGDIILQ